MHRLQLLIVPLLLSVLVVGCGKEDTPAEVVEAPAEAPAEIAPAEPEAPPSPAQTLAERAEAGDADACYEYGSQLEQAGDADAAFLWFKRAARDQHAEAAYKVGTYYHQGIATEVDLAKARRCYVIASKAEHAEAKKALVDMVLNQEQQAVHERTLTGEEFEGMSVQQALPLIKEKALREAKTWAETPEYQELVAGAKTKLYEQYGIDERFVDTTAFQPLSLLKRQVETKLKEAEVDAKVAAEYSEEAKAEAEAIAAREYPSADVGDQITIHSRRGEISGRIRSISDTEIRIGSTTVLLQDVSPAERDKLDPDYIRKGRARIMATEFYGPRAEFEEDLRTGIEDEVMLDAGYVFHNGKWGTTQQMLQYVVNPALEQATANLMRNKTHEIYRDILERNGFTVVGDRVMTLAEREQLVQQHTAAITAAGQQIAQLLQSASSPDDFTKGINLANQALSRYVLATNRDALMQARTALVEGKAKLTGIIEHQQHLDRVRQNRAQRQPRQSRPGGRGFNNRSQGRNFSNQNKLSF